MRRNLKCFAMLFVGAVSLGAAAGAALAFDVPIPPGCQNCGSLDNCKDVCGSCPNATKGCNCNAASACKIVTV